ncbi:hybrid-cluster NAD(P)-dependent oxidoreductase [Halomonas janggokensis]|uniref:Hybrid-cluster NAD(P)-dependent oxidoreductase n=1 Tax=Vreelandella janggokensis TaxID=370767 RepID=A0ABT4IW67_9GAMM|nr:hybrid-cluster NAD(P)-dependent oxidoreductase [Halomonas janggokensis]MCZ0927202.1 hybrid-cluster NAD(P)-dependent oxidoreductase [Halomonas janggokensis]MCZ0929710.1 hybrid-cluster NAD(P)-dependent oxidoreductase [Halomonas janggokensis]
MTSFTSSEFLNPVNTQTWANGRHPVRCLKITQETQDVRTYCFSMQQPVLFFFKPGQFVTLELEIDGEQVMRSYTISSAPSIPYSFSITVKRVPGGKVSNWMHDNLQEGDSIAVHGPVGQFNCIDHPAEKVLFLSGGVGITPVMSMARWYFNTNAEVDMVFAHSARTPSDIIYRAELDYMSTRIENFKLHLICEQNETGHVWGGYRGFLNREMLQLIAPDFLEREIFCCGPTLYMRAVRQLLSEAGFDFSHYHEESFVATPASDIAVAEEHAAEAQELEDVPLEGHWVTFQDAGKSVQVADGTMLHEAAASADLNIPKACGMGICGTCRVRVLEGETDMQHNGGISEEEIAEGYVLSCCTGVKGKVKVDL